MISVSLPTLLAITLSGCALTLAGCAVIFLYYQRNERMFLKWNNLTNELIGRINVMREQVDRIQAELDRVKTSLAYHVAALDYLSSEVVTDYPTAVKIARSIALGTTKPLTTPPPLENPPPAP